MSQGFASPQTSIDPLSQARYDIQSTVIYVGYASVGTASSSASWKIKKVDFDGAGNPTQTRWTGYTAVWDNRTTETYT